MELLNPEIGLFAWTMLSFLYLALCVLAISKLTGNKSIEPGTRLVWLLAILLLPFAGPIIYLALCRKSASTIA
jgi:hypothetical protein